jgi:hypothetical protein
LIFRRGEQSHAAEAFLDIVKKSVGSAASSAADEG